MLSLGNGSLPAFPFQLLEFLGYIFAGGVIFKLQVSKLRFIRGGEVAVDDYAVEASLAYICELQGWQS